MNQIKQLQVFQHLNFRIFIILILYTATSFGSLDDYVEVVEEATLNCSSLKKADFLTAQQADFICEHRQMWFKDRDSGISTEFLPKTTGESKPIKTFFAINVEQRISYNLHFIK